MLTLTSMWADYNRSDLSLRAKSISKWNRLDNEQRYNEVIKDPNLSTYSESDFYYKFNSFGFRSEELSDVSDHKILYVGCSFTEGIGLPLEHTWCYHLNNKVGQVINQNLKMFNIGKAGASIDLCIRLAYITIEQKRFTPDFVFFLMPPMNRNEFIYSEHNELEWFDYAPSNSSFRNYQERALFANYQKTFSGLQRFHETIRNLLFFKSFLDSKKIPFVLSTWCSSTVRDVDPEIGMPQNQLFEKYFPVSLGKHLVTESFIPDVVNLVSRDRLTPEVNRLPTQKEFLIRYPQNIARDGIHFGPNSNWNFANDVWSNPSFQRIIEKSYK